MALVCQLLCITAFLITTCQAQSSNEPIMYCDFDNGMCDGWEAEEDEVHRWNVTTKQPKDAGPKYDYTVHGPGGGFLYFNDTRKQFGRAIIRTPRMNLTRHAKYCLRFVYFSAGPSPGELRIYHSNRKEFGRSVSLYFTRGPRSDNDTHWLFVDVTISRFFSAQTFDDVYFRIQATRARGDNSVVAIDDMSVRSGECPPSLLPVTATATTVASVGVTEPGTLGEKNYRLPSNWTIEEVRKRNEEIIKENEERNRKIEERNALLNSGEFSSTLDPGQPTQPTQPAQPTQPNQTTTEGIAEEEKQKLIQEEQMRRQEEAKQQRIAEQERKRSEMLQKSREEQDRKAEEEREYQRQEILEKIKEEEEKWKLEANKMREELAKEEEDLKKIEEDFNITQSQQQNLNQENEHGAMGKGKRRRRKVKSGKSNNQTKAEDPNYEKCGKRYAHKTNQICCKGYPRKRSSQNTMCCGRYAYNPDKRGCCGRRTHNARGRTQCCGTKRYDSTTNACCGETPYELMKNVCIGGKIQPIVL